MESYTIIYKKVKQMTLRMQRDLTLTVTAPLRTSKAMIADFVTREQPWIDRTRAKLQLLQQNLADTRLTNQYGQLGRITYLGSYYPLCYTESARKAFQWNGDSLTLYGCDTIEARQQQVEVFYRQQATVVFGQRNQQVAAQLTDLGLPVAKLVIRKMRASWGRCYSQQQKIILNLRLIQGPVELIDAVLFHEYMHFCQPNHSSEFYQLLEHYVPDHRQCNEQLTQLIDIRGELED